MEKIESTHLYRYIQSFLSEKDYRHFMNASKGLFTDIKKETIIFEIQMKKRFQNSKLFPLYDLIHRVKDPKRQIVLRLYEISKKDLGTIFFVSPYLWKLDLWAAQEKLFKNFNFSVLNNIPVVRLAGFKGITKISEGLQGIQKLTITISTLESIHDMNVTGSLKRLIFEGCANLKHFPPQLNPEVLSEINTPSCKLVRLHFDLKEGQTTINMAKLFNDHLRLLCVRYYKKDFVIRVGSPLLHLPALALACYYTASDKADILPGFYGSSLQLEDCGSWSDISKVDLPNLRSITIDCSRNLTQLPRMPKIKKMTLSMVELVEIPSYQTLHELELYDVFMKNVHHQPNLRSLRMDRCKTIKDLRHFEGQLLKQVLIRDCDELLDISPLKNVQSLKVARCSKLSLFNIPINCPSNAIRKKRWFFAELFSFGTGNTELVFFVNIDELILYAIPFNNLIQISNISRVTLYNCYYLQMSTHWLRDVSESLIIHNCGELVSLVNLQNIPKIALLSLPNISYFSGLGHNESVYVFEVPFLEEEARRYQSDRTAGNEQFNGYHSIFSTITNFFILHPIAPPPKSNSEYDYEEEDDDIDDGDPYLRTAFSWTKMNANYTIETLWGSSTNF